MYAHTRPPPSTPETWELLEDHLRRVAGEAELPGAAAFAAPFDAGPIGRLLGLWHDLGKYAPEFQVYLMASHAGRGTRGSVNHSTAGALHAFERAAHTDPVIASVLAFAIAGHHAGLADLDPRAEQSTLRARLHGPPDEARNAIRAAPAALLAEPLPAAPPWLRSAASRPDRPLALSMFIRMAFSALVDADRLATEWFDDPAKSNSRAGRSVSMADLREMLDTRLKAFDKGPSQSAVNRVRASLLAQCREKATRPTGLFTLTAPTGSGKTLSSMAFALRHAEVHGLRHIVYALPFTSVTEQNAAEFRGCFETLNHDAAVSRIVLEHHSAFTPPRSHEKNDFGGEGEGEASAPEKWRRMATENWDAPIVVTTNVQLLESLFSNNPSDCRKLHRLARSVIVLDEAQSLPVTLLRPTLAALQELAEGYGSTVVLCSATMPAVTERPRFQIGLRNVTEIVDAPEAMAAELRRTDVRLIGHLNDEDLIDRIVETPRVLAIVNTRPHAARVFDAVVARAPGCQHLSALMCPAHRSVRVEEIKRTLADPRAPCRVVSTQVVEAGIDIDFPVVFRALAGLDSIIQSAGRCNREGRLDRGEVLVFETGEKPPPGIDNRIEVTKEVLEDGVDPLALDTVSTWFRCLYARHRNELDGGKGGTLTADLAPRHLKFRSVARAYKLIEEWSVPLVVPYGDEGAELCKVLHKAHKVEAHLLRKAQRFSVSIAPWQLDALKSQGHVAGGDTMLSVLLRESLYDENVGLRLDRAADPGEFIT